MFDKNSKEYIIAENDLKLKMIKSIIEITITNDISKEICLEHILDIINNDQLTILQN